MSLNYINVFILFYVICSACSKLKNQMGHATAWLICHFKLIKRLNLVDSVYYQPIIFPQLFQQNILVLLLADKLTEGKGPYGSKIPVRTHYEFFGVAYLSGWENVKKQL